ncbi:MAG: hypothetical protein K6B41_01330 [Butyrivibrio sp.]|nr:hypothetical protein [Butyrivibrio sp.]
MKNNNSKRLVILTALVIIGFIYSAITTSNTDSSESAGSQEFTYSSESLSLIDEESDATTTEDDSSDSTSVYDESEDYSVEGISTVTYTFRNNKLLNSHYEKHGIEMGFADADEYVAAANYVINNPDSLHKLEAEDGDDVYFLESTSEFVVVSTDGYIRTYYYADLDYFNRQ